MAARIGGEGKFKLLSSTSMYVDLAGNDATGTGTFSNPWQTLGYADLFLRNNVDFNSQRLDLIMKTPGTYTGVASGGGYAGGGVLSVHGATNSTAYVVQDTGLTAGGVFRLDFDTATQIRFAQMTFKPISNFTDCVWLNCN